MKKHAASLLCLILLTLGTGLHVTGLAARDKKVTYGKTTWYTEQNSFNEIIRLARKSNKPILANFSATWCRPCEVFKKTVFKSDDFRKVADEVILLYIEQTEEKGMEYVNNNRVVVFPTFKIFDKDGTALDSSFPGDTADAFLKWIKEVKAGNNYHELSLKLKRNPKDRTTLQKLLEKIENHEVDKKITYLRRLIDIQPDPADPITIWAYKKMLSIFPASLRYKNRRQGQEYAKAHETEFNRVLDICHPKMEGFTPKDSTLLADIIVWFNTIGRYNRALNFFDRFLDVTREKRDFAIQLPVYSAAMVSYIHLNRKGDFKRLFGMVRAFVQKDKKIYNKPSFIIYYIRMYRTLIELFIEKKNREYAEFYSGQLLDQAIALKEEENIKAYMYNLARHHGILTGRMIRMAEKDIKKTKDIARSNFVDIKAAILVKKGKKKQAYKFLMDYYRDETRKPAKTRKQLRVRAEVLNTVAWAMVEMRMVDQKTLAIITKAVEIREDPYNLDTLASVLALMGDVKKAIEVEERALSLTENAFLIKEYKDKIAMWEKQLEKEKERIKK